MPAKQETVVDRDTGTVRRRVTFETKGPSLTEQHHKAHVDVNNIMARYVKTGTLDHVRRYEGQYSDLSPDDYHTSLNKVTAAQSMFEELPSQLRNHFENRVDRFLDFCLTHDAPSQELARIAEEHRRAALGLDTDDSASTPPGGSPGEQGSEPPGSGGAMAGQDGPPSAPQETPPPQQPSQ